MSAWKKFVAFGDTHGDMVHQPTLDAFTQFIKDYKPDFKIHIGDLFDYRSLRQGIKATETDAYDDLRADSLAGYIDGQKEHPKGPPDIRINPARRFITRQPRPSYS